MKYSKYILFPSLVVLGLLIFQLELINKSVENSNVAFENLVLLRLAEIGEILEEEYYCYRTQAVQFIPSGANFHLFSSLAGASKNTDGTIEYGKKDTLIHHSKKDGLFFKEFYFGTETRVNMRFDFEFLPLDIHEYNPGLNSSEKYVIKTYKHFVLSSEGERLMDTLLFDSLFTKKIGVIKGENRCFVKLFADSQLIYSNRGSNQEDFEMREGVALYKSSLLPEIRAEIYLKNPSILSVMNQWYFAPIIIVLTLFLLLLFYRSYNMIKESDRIILIKTDFINMMTHEFNTPITNLKLTIENYNDKLSEIKKQKLFTIMNIEVERLRSNFQTLFQVNKLSANELTLNLQDHDVNELIEKTCDAFEMYLQENQVDVALNLSKNKPMVLLDEIHMLNVFSNIIDNSIKYGGNNTTIRISSTVLKNRVRIDISDNGIGMSKEIKNQAFDKYFRSTDLHVQTLKGMGLGLFYVKKIVNLHKGEIEIESKEGQGTSVRITFNLSSHGKA